MPAHQHYSLWPDRIRLNAGPPPGSNHCGQGLPLESPLFVAAIEAHQATWGKGIIEVAGTLLIESLKGLHRLPSSARRLGAEVVLKDEYPGWGAGSLSMVQSIC